MSGFESCSGLHFDVGTLAQSVIHAEEVYLYYSSYDEPCQLFPSVRYELPHTRCRDVPHTIRDSEG